MIVFLVVICIMCIFVSRCLWGKEINPVSYSVWYILITHLLAFNGVWGIIKCSEKVYLLSVLGVVGIFTGAVLSTNNLKIFVKENNKEKYLSLNEKVVFFLLCIVTGTYIVAFFRVLIFVFSGENWDILRNMYFGIGNSSTSLLTGKIQFVIEYFSNPLLHVLMPFACIALLAPEITKCKKIYVLIIFFDCILQMVISGGGRMILVELFFQLVLTLLMIKGKFLKKNRMSEAHKRKFLYVLLYGGILFGVIYYASLNRGSGLFTPIKTLYNYFVGGIANTSIKLETTYFEEPLLGKLSFFGLWNLLAQIGEGIGLKSIYVDRIIEYMHYLNIPLNIGSSSRFNAFVTMFYMFYIDGGYVAVVLFSVFIGYVNQRAYIRYKREPNEKRLTLLIMLFSSLLYINIRSPYYQRYVVMALIYRFLLYKYGSIRTLKFVNGRN